MVTQYTERDLMNRAEGQDIDSGFIVNKNLASTDITAVLGTLSGKGYNIKKIMVSTGVAKSFSFSTGTDTSASQTIKVGTLYGAANSTTVVDFVPTYQLRVNSGDGLYIKCSAADACTVIVEGSQE
jgi:hypothetical protein